MGLAPMLPATPLSVCARRSARAASPCLSAAEICPTGGPCCSANWRRSFKYSFRFPATRDRPSLVSRPGTGGRSSFVANGAVSACEDEDENEEEEEDGL